MNVKFLTELFDVLNQSNLKYCVLRGYEELPLVVKNDIDFGIAPENKIQFFSILKSLSLKFNYEINIELIRHSVIKMELKNEFGNFIKIDVWWQFNYLGLEYLCVNKLLSSRKIYNNNFFIPSTEYEFALSFLKELMHNNCIRKDKIEYLNKLLNSSKKTPFIEFFNLKIIEAFFRSVRENKFELKILSMRAKLFLLINNFLNLGFTNTLINIHSFIFVKYFNTKKYTYITNLISKKK